MRRASPNRAAGNLWLSLMLGCWTGTHSQRGLWFCVVSRRRVVPVADAVAACCVDLFSMHERYAAVFRVDGTEAAGLLEIEESRFSLRGRGAKGELELVFAFS